MTFKLLRFAFNNKKVIFKSVVKQKSSLILLRIGDVG